MKTTKPVVRWVSSPTGIPPQQLSAVRRVVCSSDLRTESLVQCATSEAEMRLTITSQDLAKSTAMLCEAEASNKELESQVRSLSMGTSQLEATEMALQDRALAAEERALQAEVNAREWEARATIAEAKLMNTMREADALRLEAEATAASLTREVEKNTVAESRAAAAEGSVGCLETRIEALARQFTITEARAEERVIAAENMAVRRMQDAEKRVDQAERRAQSSERSASLVFANYRKEASLAPSSPRRSLRGNIAEVVPQTGSAMSSPRSAVVSAGTALSSPRNSTPRCSLRDIHESVTAAAGSPKSRHVPLSSPSRAGMTRRLSLGSPQSGKQTHAALEVIFTPTGSQVRNVCNRIEHVITTGSLSTAVPSESNSIMGSVGSLS